MRFSLGHVERRVSRLRKRHSSPEERINFTLRTKTGCQPCFARSGSRGPSPKAPCPPPPRKIPPHCLPTFSRANFFTKLSTPRGGGGHKPPSPQPDSGFAPVFHMIFSVKEIFSVFCFIKFHPVKFGETRVSRRQSFDSPEHICRDRRPLLVSPKPAQCSPHQWISRPSCDWHWMFFFRQVDDKVEIEELRTLHTGDIHYGEAGVD